MYISVYFHVFYFTFVYRQSSAYCSRFNLCYYFNRSHSSSKIYFPGRKRTCHEINQLPPSNAAWCGQEQLYVFTLTIRFLKTRKCKIPLTPITKLQSLLRRFLRRYLFNNIIYIYLVPNFTQIRREIWKIGQELIYAPQ